MRIPDRLMQAIGVVESGRRDEQGGVTAWLWTINVEGVGQVFETKADAIAAVTAHRARGARSIDAPTGRGLDAYRAAPTRLATNAFTRRG